MTLPSSGPISINDVCAEFGVASNTPFPSGFYGKPGFPSSGAFSLSQCYGLSNNTFTPDGGSVVASGNGVGQATVTCTLPAVWTYSGGGGGGSVNVANGDTATSITFTVIAAGSAPNRITRNRVWTLTGVSGGITRNFTVDVTAEGD